jgi:hypothetical protein
MLSNKFLPLGFRMGLFRGFSLMDLKVLLGLWLGFRVSYSLNWMDCWVEICIVRRLPSGTFIKYLTPEFQVKVST